MSQTTAGHRRGGATTVGLPSSLPGKVSRSLARTGAWQRKCRLWGVACVRHFLAAHPVSPGNLREFVELGLRKAEELAEALADEAFEAPAVDFGPYRGGDVCFASRSGRPGWRARVIEDFVEGPWDFRYSCPAPALVGADRPVLGALREILGPLTEAIEPAVKQGFGRLFQRTAFKLLAADAFAWPPCDVSPLLARGGLVPTMAATIYSERRWSDLPVLADALEDAGCDNQAILRHCRYERPHARGCWVLDALLQKSRPAPCDWCFAR